MVTGDERDNTEVTGPWPAGGDRNIGICMLFKNA